jgi:hypothetical protein
VLDVVVLVVVLGGGAMVVVVVDEVVVVDDGVVEVVLVDVVVVVEVMELVVLVEVVLLVVVEVLVGVVVVQSQQLPVSVLAVPSFGALHFAALLLILHFTLPFLVVRQHRTPLVPQVDFAAHFFTAPAQLLLTRTAFACWIAQLT